MEILALPQLAWYGASTLELPLPDNWTGEIRNMAGYNRTALGPEAIRQAVRQPFGSPPIRNLARGRRQVAIIFDDMARATRAAQIVPFILEELAEGGIEEKNIRFVGASGSHIAMDRLDFVKKLGEQVVSRFRVYSHNPFGHCSKIGATAFGTEIWANSEVMKCDLKIAVGSIVPHGTAGFSGGAKIVLPGICSFRTISAFHQFETEARKKRRGAGIERSSIKDNPSRLNMEEAASLVGLDIKIDAIMNSYGETVALYCGKPERCFEEAVKDARENYFTPFSADSDIVIANTYAKANELEVGVSLAFPSLKEEGGSVVLIGNAPEGHIPHYLFGPWGTEPHARQTQINIPPNVYQVIVFSQYPDLTVSGYFRQTAKVKVMSNWGEVLAQLKKSCPARARVAVYPNADIQYISSKF